ncbi:hypothetical protein XENOCAPTIV_025611 [Xenoophorus captivus]|uniref:Uncharacterized protein n=1 Tax=Xenoophorus captivus TaxID=1517983 RepID=A0ABV0RUQ0_9TELE
MEVDKAHVLYEANNGGTWHRNRACDPYTEATVLDAAAPGSSPDPGDLFFMSSTSLSPTSCLPTLEKIAKLKATSAPKNKKINEAHYVDHVNLKHSSIVICSFHIEWGSYLAVPAAVSVIAHL